MYNTDLPRRADLPTSAQLKRSTAIAAAVAFVLLFTVVLPSEYAIDPTRAGRILGFTQMGEVKVQLAAEAAADAVATPAPGETAPAEGQAEILARLDRIEALLGPAASSQARAPQPSVQPPAEEFTIETLSRFEPPPESSPAPAATSEPAPVPVPVPAPNPASGQVAVVEPPSVPQASSGRTDEASVVLPPGEGAEIKLVMEEGASANFAWSANGSVVNFDTHGDGGGNSISYEKGRSVAADEGVLTAAFTGNHGWFWRNRTDTDVTVTVRTTGDYSEFKRMK